MHMPWSHRWQDRQSSSVWQTTQPEIVWQIPFEHFSQGSHSWSEWHGGGRVPG
jgi:hypothetical protein